MSSRQHTLGGARGRFAIALALAAVVSTVAVPAAELARGPYLQLGTSTSVVVRWRTLEPTSSRVLWGPAPDDLTRVAESAAPTAEHTMTLAELTPDSVVCYAVGDATGVLAGGDADHCFRTAPPRGARVPTRIWVLGDSGTGNQAQADVRDAYYAYPGADETNLWLMLGDNAYPRATDEEFQSKLFDVYPATLRRAVLWPTIGNHNGSSDSPTQTGPYFEAFDLPTGGEAGGLPSGTEAYYAFDWANVHFVVLDTFDTDASPDGPMLSWFEADLAATAQDWVIVYFHHPPYSKGSRDSDVEPRQILIRETVVPLLDSYGVDLTLTGHSHSYERSYLIAGHYGDSTTFDTAMQVAPGDGDPAGDGPYAKAVVGPDPFSGVVYAVAGSSGQISGGTLDHPAMAVSLNLHGSLVLDVDGQRLDVRFLDRFGDVRDHVAMTKAAGIELPEANFGVSPDTGTVPLQVRFTDLSTNAPTSWSWDFDGDGTAESHQQNPSWSFTEPGIWDVRLVVANEAGADERVAAAAVCAAAARPVPLAGLAFDDPVTMRWALEPDGIAYDVVRAAIANVRAGDAWSEPAACRLGRVAEPTTVDATAPPVGGFAYLVRAVDCTNRARPYDSGGDGQLMPRSVTTTTDCE